jgi:hypothetical protein
MENNFNYVAEIHATLGQIRESIEEHKHGQAEVLQALNAIYQLIDDRLTVETEPEDS